jgi:hypothetical protein
MRWNKVLSGTDDPPVLRLTGCRSAEVQVAHAIREGVLKVQMKDVARARTEIVFGLKRLFEKSRYLSGYGSDTPVSIYPLFHIRGERRSEEFMGQTKREEHLPVGAGFTCMVEYTVPVHLGRISNDNRDLQNVLQALPVMLGTVDRENEEQVRLGKGLHRHAGDVDGLQTLEEAVHVDREADVLVGKGPVKFDVDAPMADELLAVSVVRNRYSCASSSIGIRDGIPSRG